MRWQGRRRSQQIEDRRSEGGGTGRAGSDPAGTPSGAGRTDGPGNDAGDNGPASPVRRLRRVILSGVLAFLLIVLMLAGPLFLPLLLPLLATAASGRQADAKVSSHAATRPAASASSAATTAQAREHEDWPATTMQRDMPEETLANFVAVVLADTETVWTRLLQAEGLAYAPPTLVLYRNRIDSACGGSETVSGPFYCPGDQKIYLDLQFAADLEQRLDAPGDFALAYVLAHEVGHHIQHLLGISAQAAARQPDLSADEWRGLQIRLELQADYLAGVWAHHARSMDLLEPGDVEEALQAAAAVGDDRIQLQTQGYVVPDSFTHGSAAQRVMWFRRGLDSGNLADGDTFK